jgi:50S ribosomal subunit-associated GTPase HflX
LAVNPVAISAERGWGLDELLGALETALEREDQFVPVRLGVPFARAELIDRFYRHGRVVERRDDDLGTTLIGVLPASAIGQFGEFIAREPDRQRPRPEAVAEPVA